MVVPHPQSVAGWFVSAFFVLGSTIACGVALIWSGIDPARAHLAGTSGWVSVSQCHWQAERPKGWACTGTFNGHGITIENIRIRHPLAEEPVNPVETVVSGPHATTAWTPGPVLLLPVISGTFILGIVPYFTLYYWWRGCRERAAEAARDQRPAAGNANPGTGR